MNNFDIKKDALTKAIRGILSGKGLCEKEINACLKSWEYAENSEKFSHGYERVGWLVETINKKKIVPNSPPKVVKKNIFCYQLFGNKSLGYRSAYEAVDLAIKSAKENGIGISTMSDCYPTGCIGEYTEEMVKNDLIGIAISSSPARVAAYGTAERIFPTLGHSFGFPGIKLPYIYDSSVGALTHGDIQLAKKSGRNLPPKTVMTNGGEYTINPNELFDEGGIFNGIISIAGGMNSHKFSGLAGSLELLARLALVNEGTEPTPEGYSFFMALGPEMFGGVDRLKLQVDRLQRQIKNARKLTETNETYFAGEQSYISRQNSKSTVLITEKTFNLLKSYL
jgi:LDH2 family malate/lactate/ureidoglycolate dehydrogenase